MHATIFSATTVGIDAHKVWVEVDVSFGLVQFYIVGLPDTAIKESSKRIRTALQNSGIRLPAKRITVNLAPADLKKEGTLFDLPIAIGILYANENIPLNTDFLNNTLFLGELSLDGSVRSIKGALAIAYNAHKIGMRRLILPEANVAEISMVDGLEVIGINHIAEIVAYLKNERTLPIIHTSSSAISINTACSSGKSLDFAQVKGQHAAKRALQIAAAGRHNILFIGPPGAGKTTLAKRLLSIMPPLSLEESIETSMIYSITGALGKNPRIGTRPFRNPHHSISQPGLIGGGSYPQPGEISLAHNGILFLDELTEFKRDTIEALRQPLEQGTVCIARAQQTIQFPASFILVAALNPCPCGFYRDKKRACTCLPQQIDKYLDKLSGPLLDRIDIQITIESLDYETMINNQHDTITSAYLSAGVQKAEITQRERFSGTLVHNATMDATAIETHCTLTPAGKQLMKMAFEKLNLSMRSYHKLLKIARTIADLEEKEHIEPAHVQEALLYRSLDRYREKRQ